MRLLLSLALILFLAAPSAVKADQTSSRLGDLFADLQSETDAAEARRIEREIWRIWALAHQESVRGHFAAGILYLQSGYPADARLKFDYVIREAPRFAEAWNKRATVAFLLGDYEASVRDIQKTLALEPRHFGALSGLAQIYEATGLEETALDVLVRLKEIYPAMRGLDDRMIRLREAISRKRT